MSGKEIVTDRTITKTEKQDNPEAILHEERYYLESDQIIQYELNMLELPFFSKNGKVKENQSIKYHFSDTTESYMQIIPFNNERAGYKIPQEFDEKIFLALMRLAKTEGKKFITTYYQLLNLAKIQKDGRSFKRVKESIYRLRYTAYLMKNCFYSPLLRTVVPNEREYKIISDLTFLELDKVKTLPDEILKKYSKYFTRNKAETLVQITLSDEIYSNIEDKGYLYYDVEELLAIGTGGERKLYQMLMKWSHKGKYETISKKCKYLAAKIPLSVTQDNISNTIRTLKKYSHKLVQDGYIQDFQFIKESPVLESSMMFKMNPKTSKQQIIVNENIKLMEKNKADREIIIESDILQDEDTNQTSIFDVQETISKEIDTLMNIIPEEHRTKANISLTEKYYKSKGEEFVRSNIEYTKDNAKDFSSMYFLALEKDFAEKERLKKKAAKNPPVKKADPVDEEKIKQKEKAKKLRDEAYMIYESLEGERLTEYEEKSQNTSFYKIMLKDKIDNGTMLKKEAIKEAIIMLILGEIDR